MGVQMKQVDVHVEVCREGVVLPAYAREGDAGMDVCAAEEVLLGPGDTLIVPTGLKFAIPEGYEIQVRPRSGLTARTPLRVSNAPGTIDSGYRDEVGIIMTNTSEICSYCYDEDITLDDHGNRKGNYRIRKGDRIAQLVLKEVPRMRLVPVACVRDIGTDRGGGFGSTGVSGNRGEETADS
jgi:dUTP pyrophosphatase